MAEETGFVLAGRALQDFTWVPDAIRFRHARVKPEQRSVGVQGPATVLHVQNSGFQDGVMYRGTPANPCCPFVTICYDDGWTKRVQEEPPFTDGEAGAEGRYLIWETNPDEPNQWASGCESPIIIAQRNRSQELRRAARHPGIPIVDGNSWAHALTASSMSIHALVADGTATAESPWIAHMVTPTTHTLCRLRLSRHSVLEETSPQMHSSILAAFCRDLT
jgi:hypothetical protein